MQKGQRPIVKRNIGLEYALLVASNSHISTTLSHLLWKNINDSKSYVLAVPMIMSFKVLKYFFSGKISFLLLLACGNEISNRNKMIYIYIFFFRNLDLHNSRLFSQEKWWFVAGICLIWKLMEYTNDHSPDASIIPTF